ncbi:hypothetical protein CF326_g7540 [Tilletia indica]|nr:hypothetical protein CF326_g7540 [Tilletia indica]
MGQVVSPPTVTAARQPGHLPAAAAARGLPSQVTSLSNRTRIALRTGFKSGQQTYSMPHLCRLTESSTDSADTRLRGSLDRLHQLAMTQSCQSPRLCFQTSDKFLAAYLRLQCLLPLLNCGPGSIYTIGPICTVDITVESQVISKQAFAAAGSVTNEGLGTSKFM